MERVSERVRHLAYCSSLVMFDDRHAVDLVATSSHIERLVQAGIGVCMPGAGTGEGNTLSPDEIYSLLATAVKTAAGRVPVVGYGTEPRTAKDFKPFVEACVEASVDAVVLSPPDPGHGYHPNERALDAYFSDLLETSPIRTYVATHLAVGYEVPVELLASLSGRFSSIAGFFVTHYTNSTYLLRLRGLVGDEYEIVAGGVYRILDSLADGASGWLSSIDMNVAPQFSSELVAALDAGDWTAIKGAFQRTHRLLEGLKAEGVVNSAKAALDLLGLYGGPVRPPQIQVDESAHARISELLVEVGLQPIASSALVST